MTTDLANYRGTDCEYQNETYLGNYGKGPEGTYRKTTVDVGSFCANGFGLCDMHGNVWEWCLDDWHNSYEGTPTNENVWESFSEIKVLRGGSWNNNPVLCRAANRYRSTREHCDDFIGFRLICSVAPKT